MSLKLLRAEKQLGSLDSFVAYLEERIDHPDFIVRAFCGESAAVIFAPAVKNSSLPRMDMISLVESHIGNILIAKEIVSHAVRLNADDQIVSYSGDSLKTIVVDGSNQQVVVYEAGAQFIYVRAFWEIRLGHDFRPFIDDSGVAAVVKVYSDGSTEKNLRHIPEVKLKAKAS